MRRGMDYAELLAFQLKLAQLPLPVREFKPFPDRKFRIDCAYPDRLIAIEVDGGEWVVGRHSRGSGMSKDNEKCNRLTAEGWSVFKFVGSDVKSGAAVNFLEGVLR